MEFVPPDFENKIIEPDKLTNNLSSLRENHSKIVFTNGCFDILHRGHVTYLAQAKSLGDFLIVALNSDESVKRQNKGEDRPINNLANRMAVIASLASVDAVTFFNEDTPFELIMEVRPNILVKGGDWPIDKIVGSQEVLQYGGQVYSIPFIFNTSTTSIVNKIRHV